MDRTIVMRRVLWAAALFNVVGALTFLYPSSVVQIMGVPLPAPHLYAWFSALMVGTFAGVYAWLAGQSTIDRPLVVVAVIGKLGFFVILLACWLLDEIPARAPLIATVDVVFAMIFFWWLAGVHQASARAQPAVPAHDHAPGQ